MVWRKQSAKVIYGVFGLCLALDIFVALGRQILPDEVGRTICGLRLFGALARLLFPYADGWSQYVEQACRGFPSDAAISIIAFLLKISLISLGLLVVISTLSLREKAEDSREGTLSSPRKEANRTVKPVRWGPVFIIFILPAAVVWWFFARLSPNDFHGSVAWIMFEDVFLFIYFGAGIFTWLAFVDLALLPLLRRLLPDRNWIKTR